MATRTARTGRECGQMLVLFVLALGVLMGFAAMTIDVGMILVERRRLQNAADAAALAGAPALPPEGNSATAMALAREWAAKNGLVDGVDGVTINVQTPHNGDDKQIKVTIEKDVPFMFARTLGMDHANAHASAVAIKGQSHGYAIYAHKSGCTPPQDVEITGSNVAVTGNIHSNGNLKINSSDIQLEGNVTSLCEPHISNSNLTLSGEQKVVTEAVEWPVYYEYSDFHCDYTSVGDMVIDRSSTQYWVNDDPDTNTLKPGVYCAEGNISVEKEAHGNVTFAARGTVHFGTDAEEASRFGFTAREHNVLAYSGYASPYGSEEEDAWAIKVAADEFHWQGIILATQGGVHFSTSDVFSDSGSIVAETVKIATSTGSITAAEGTVSGPTKLIE